MTSTTLSAPLPPKAPVMRTLADLLRRLGNIPPERVRLHPAPGTATVADLLHVAATENRSCELVDGVLVEKSMGYTESLLAGHILFLLKQFILPRNLGHVSAPDGTMQILPGLVRIPDVAYISWERMPGRTRPTEAVPELVPDLVVEILSVSNTLSEMAIKRDEYFRAGVVQLWEVDPDRRTVTVYRSATQASRLSGEDTLDGGEVLPGFSLSVADLFAELDRRG